MERIGIIGNGGQADEARSYIGDDNILFNAVSKEYTEGYSSSNTIDILSPSDFEKQVPVIAAIGAPGLRKEMIDNWSGAEFSIIKADQSYVDKSAIIGEGTIIAPGAIITTDVIIGAHSIINIATTISHGCNIGSFTTLSPGVHIGGNVNIGEGVFVGIGAIISNGLSIAPGSVIGAGAVVVKNIVKENSVVVGVPANVVRYNTGWIREI